MEHKYIGSGVKDFTPKNKKDFEDKREKSRKDKQPAELKKTREEKEMIEVLASSIYKEMERLGIKSRPFPLEAIHLMPQHFFWYPGAGVGAKGSYRIPEDKIQIDASRKEYGEKEPTTYKRILDYVHKLLHLAPISYLSDKEYDGHAILHELTHSQSKQGFRVDEEGGVIGYKSGLVSAKKEEQLDEGAYFQGLNEAVTEKITRELFIEIKGKVFDEQKVKDFVETQKDHPYTEYIEVLDKIIESIAQFKHIDKNKVWDDIKISYFKGELMYFRKIEDIFGIGSLRIIASMDKKAKNSSDNPERQKKIEKYFSSGTTFNEREKLAREILDDEEYGMYETHRSIIDINKPNKYL